MTPSAWEQLLREHRARFRGVWWVTVTCSCGWVQDRRPGRRRAREAYAAHVILTAYSDEYEKRRLNVLSADEERRP